MPFGDVLTPLLTSLALMAVVAAIALYALYWIVRKAVAHGMRDARRAEADPARADGPA